MITNKVQIEGIIQYAYTLPRDFLRKDILSKKILAQIKNEIESHNPDFKLIEKLIHEDSFKEMFISLSYSYSTQKLILMNKLVGNKLYSFKDTCDNVNVSFFDEDEIVDCFLAQEDVVVIFKMIDEYSLELSTNEFSHYEIDIINNQVILINKSDNKDVIYTSKHITDKKLQRRIKLTKIKEKIRKG